MKPMSQCLNIAFCWAALLPLSTLAAPSGYTTLNILLKPGTGNNGLNNTAPLNNLRRLAPTLQPLLPASIARTPADTQALQRHRLDRYYTVDIRPMSLAQAQALAAQLKADPSVENVQLEPVVDGMHGDNGLAIGLASTPSIPDYTGRQTYLLGQAPVAPYRIGGINAVEAWKIPGGKGQNMQVVSSEVDHWSFSHLDLPKPYLEIQHPTNPALVGSHDTASAGIIASRENGFGTTGIAQATELGFMDWGQDRLIQLAERLHAGNVVQIGVHYLYPAIPQVGCATDCYMPVEYNAVVRDTIAYMTEEKGIHVVLAAANGNINLDAAYFNGFFDRQKFDSGGIYAGAVDPKSGLRAGYSEYGSRVDLFSWGENVTTTSYTKNNPDSAYTHTFSGTSSANPIIAGVVASLQGVALAHDLGPIPPKELRAILVTTGYPQINGNRTEIGVQPDLDAAIRKMLADHAGKPPTGRLAIPDEAPSAGTFSNHVYAESSAGKPLFYRWNTAGFTPATGHDASLSLTAPAVNTDTVMPVSVDVSDGTHTITLTESVIIKAPPITATLTAPEAAGSGDSVPVRVDARSSTGKPLSYTWASSASLLGSPGNTPQATYTAAPVTSEVRATVNVRVSDGRDFLQTPTQVITIRPRQATPPPEARITGANTAEVGKTLALSASTSSGSGLRYAWTAPDFIPATSTQVAPGFTAPPAGGPRSITLRITDATHREATATHIVNVTAPAPGNCGTIPAWDPAKTYAVFAEQVAYNGKVYKQNFYNINKPPDVNSAEWGKEWHLGVPCP
ncbi:S8 family peptidase [Pseudomonas cremoris]|uniref:S8 family peptidase n=1 Tax=Pseudomonas cremoris TaxID=2724178 RepID=UPI00289FC77C|nr:S8 family serine peptidase [Pseudomonas cremoris]